MDKRPHIIVHGSDKGAGNSAKITALALAEAGLAVALFAPETTAKPPENTQNPVAHDQDWQSVLALSPSSRLMLEVLGVWQRLDLASSPIFDMQVYGTADDIGADGYFASHLSFAGQHDDASTDKAENDQTMKPAPHIDAALAHIVSLASLGRALHEAMADKIASGAITALPAPVTDVSQDGATAHLADGTNMPFDLLVDTCSPKNTPPPAWRKRHATQALQYDYKAAALVGMLNTSRPHGNIAQQIFLPDGPLALLPLPDKNALAMVWSLPAARANALGQCPKEILAHELAVATQNRFGCLTPAGPVGLQPLSLYLAQNPIDENIVLLGEAAHLIHPLAGQGFNLTLRDAAHLADILYQARSLGLTLHDGGLLGDYAVARRSAAFEMATTTHGLNELFTGYGAALGRFGLAMTARAAEKTPALGKVFIGAANATSLVDMPRLLRGRGFNT